MNANYYLKLFACICAVVFGVSGCAYKPPTQGPRDESIPTPSIAPKPIPTTGKLNIDRKALPPRAGAQLPAFDGDAFFVSIPARESGGLNADEVLRTAVVPVLRAVGFQRDVKDLGLPRPTGTKLPTANLAKLASVTCLEVDSERYRRYQPVCDAMRKGQASPTAERVFQIGDGMSSAQFKADLERVRIQYAYRQLVNNVPIEHSGVLAARWEGETVTTVHGSVFNRYVVTNQVRLKPQAAIAAGLKQLVEIKGVIGLDKSRRQPERSDLVLLPYGGARATGGDEVPGLRYAYRVLLFGLVPITGTKQVERGSWLAWVDADSGQILQLIPQFAEVAAIGEIWRRDPTTPTQVTGFEVDPASGGQYTLELNDVAPGVFTRIDRLGDGDFNDDEISISDAAAGSSPTLANFNQAPINDDANALCQAGGNNTYRQVNALTHLYRYRQLIVNAGTFSIFPEAATTVWVDTPGSDTNSASYDFFGAGQSRLRFTNGSAFAHVNCPNEPNTKFNGAQDPTTMSHEFAHISTKRLHNRRESDWCGMAPCAMPTGSALFHDFADAYAHGYASTPCMSGFSNKNVGGANASLNCIANHSEAGSLPRLAEVTLPFDPADPRDHFPEHRTLAIGDYADGQIAAAALWSVRQGMRSKCLPSGTAQYWVRLNRALWNFGFLASSCVGCDRDIYRYAQDLMRQMTEQWATAGQPGGPLAFHHNGAHTTNKVTSGFGKTGIFLIPHQCIDGDATTEDAAFCPVAAGGENGGDAVVDVDDNDTTDDTVIDNITHREVDYLRRTGVAPTFQVWTGPRYKFNAAGSATAFTPSVATPSSCNTQFQVEIASDDTFTTNLATSGWIAVSTTASPECYGTWTPDAATWNTLKGVSGDTKVFYRARTRDAVNANEKISTSPGNGMFTVPPAYLISNNAGTP